MNAVTYQSAFLDRHTNKKEKQLFEEFQAKGKAREEPNAFYTYKEGYSPHMDYANYLLVGHKGFDEFKEKQNFDSGRSDLDKATLAYDRAGYKFDKAKANLQQFLVGKENSAFTDTKEKVSLDGNTKLGTKNPEAKQTNALLNDVAKGYLNAYIGGLLAPYLKDSAEKTSVEGVRMQNKMPALLPNEGMGGNEMAAAAEDRNERLYKQKTKMGSLFTGLT